MIELTTRPVLPTTTAEMAEAMINEPYEERSRLILDQVSFQLNSSLDQRSLTSFQCVSKDDV